MNRLYGKNLLAVSVCVLAAMSLSGCFEYKETIDIARDGAGTVHITGWIDAKLARSFYTPLENADEGAPHRPPISKKLANKMAGGSSNVQLTDFNIELDDGKWVFDATLKFETLKDLAKIPLFKNRKPLLTYVTPKEVSYRRHLKTTLTGLMLEVAKDLKPTENTYVVKFTGAMSDEKFAKEFAANYAQANVIFTVLTRGTSATGADIVTYPELNRVRAEWSFLAGDLAANEEGEKMEMLVRLPPEKGFTEVVMVVLALSVIGILVPAIRLVIMKIQGVS